MGWGEAIGSALDIADGYKQKHANRSSASKARKFTREQHQNRHQWEAADLEKAGLNRILTMGGQPPISGVQAHAQSQKKFSTAADVQQGKLTRAQVQQLAAATGREVSQTQKNNAETNVANESAKAIQLENTRRSQEEQVYNENPWLRKIKAVTDSLGGLGAVLLGGGAATAGYLKGRGTEKSKSRLKPTGKMKPWKPKKSSYKSSDTHHGDGRRRKNPSWASP